MQFSIFSGKQYYYRLKNVHVPPRRQ